MDSGVWGLPPGIDFPRALVAGLRHWAEGRPPEVLARTTLILNTRRMARRVREVFAEAPPTLLPRIALLGELGGAPSGRAALLRKLDLARLVAELIAQRPDLAPQSATFALADSLARLLDEMEGEGVAVSAIADLDVGDVSGHWQRSRDFVALVAAHLQYGIDAPDPIAAQIAAWRTEPPTAPVIVAGSTGSRGATARLMDAVADLPTGFLLLPGFDFDLPDGAWPSPHDAMRGEDHPQFRFAALLHRLGLNPRDVRRWPGAVPDPARNRVVSLALRPAPVTDGWRRDGPGLGDLPRAMSDVSLIEAPSDRVEADAIALILRQAAADGMRAALVTPDRTLARRVTASLDRWGIRPDDSAGRPFALSAPGRFLRQVAGLVTETPSFAALLALLKHPLTGSGGDRGQHLLATRELELFARHDGRPVPDPATLRDWGARTDRSDWVAWLLQCLAHRLGPGADLADHLARHRGAAEAWAGGPAEGDHALWDAEAGAIARAEMDGLAHAAPHAPPVPPRAYRALIESVLSEAEPVREAAASHPNISIWGTLEARVQGAELVVLGSLNEGTWPAAPAPDPWLNRKLRREAGLLLPERQIGLAAHDFQQAMGAPRVILTRALRGADADTVPSRWLNRLTNLLNGLDTTRGPEAWEAMCDRGRTWITLAEAIDADLPSTSRARRPAPAPPTEARPRRLNVTEIRDLRRDPYAVYARRVLRLRPLPGLTPELDPLLRGIVVHRILHHVVKAGIDPKDRRARAAFMSMADEVLAADVHWPAARRVLRAILERASDWFLAGETSRRDGAAPLLLERTGEWAVPGTGTTLVGRPDRIDRRPDGGLVIWDYKTGEPPSKKQIRTFDRQLLLEALMAEAGAFGETSGPAAQIGYIRVGTKLNVVSYGSDEDIFDLEATRTDLVDLLRAYDAPDLGYSSRRAVETMDAAGDYDHLARFGEWDDSDAAHHMAVGG